jgi:hypothetical protein
LHELSAWQEGCDEANAIEGNEAEDGGETRVDRHRHGQAVRAARRWRQVQGVGRRRQVAISGPAQEGEDEGQERAGRQGRPVGVAASARQRPRVVDRAVLPKLTATSRGHDQRSIAREAVAEPVERPGHCAGTKGDDDVHAPSENFDCGEFKQPRNSHARNQVRASAPQTGPTLGSCHRHKANPRLLPPSQTWS